MRGTLLTVACLMVVALVLGQYRLSYSQSCIETQPVVQGAESPCTGILWPSLWSLEAVQIKNIKWPQCQADLLYFQGRFSACKGHVEGLEDLCNVQLGKLRQVAESAAGIVQPWWKSPTVVGFYSFALGVVATSAVVYVVK